MTKAPDPDPIHPPQSGAAATKAIEAVFRIESPRLIAGLTRIVRDVGAAEELAQDALVAALEQWPKEGVPQNPGAWLMTTAKHHAINLHHRRKRLDRKHEELGHQIDLERELNAPDLAIEDAIDDDVGDDLLRLVFIACHPVLSTEARVALTLRLLGGLSTQDIARAFLVPEPTIAQRIVRAKRTLAEERIPFEAPHGAELTERLSSVLGVLYLVFNEGYSATAGDDLMRPALCEDAMRLGRILVGLMPNEAEVHGLVALMELHASRAASRVSPSGEPILLMDQNRARWDQLLIRRGLSALENARSLVLHSNTEESKGSYLIQAEISACHARARTAAQTDWHRIAALYAELMDLTPSPVIELNRAMAVAMADGPLAGLTLVDALMTDPAMKAYYLLPTARADLLMKLGRFDEAHDELMRAASLTQNARERTLLLERAASCAASRNQTA